MKTLWIAILLLEVGGLGAWLALRTVPPVPPELNLTRLDSATAADLEALRQSTGDWAENWTDYGEACLAFGYFPEAEACLVYANEKQPGVFRTAFALAYARQRLGRLEQAIADFEAAAILAPPDQVDACWYHIARCYLRLENVEKAEQTFRRRPGFPLAVYHLARILVTSGREEEGLVQLDRLDKMSPGALQSQQLRTRAEEQLGRPVSDWTRRDRERGANRLSLSDHQFYLTPFRFRHGATRQVGDAVKLRQGGRQEIASKMFHQLLPVVNSDDRLKVSPMLAELDMELGHPDRSEKLLLDHFAIANESPKTTQLMGDVQMFLRRPDKAAEWYQRSLTLRPTTEIYLRLTQMALMHKDEPLARKYQAWQHACDGKQALQKREYPAALDYLQMASKELTQEPSVWYDLGQAAEGCQQPDLARTAYETCLKLYPGYGRAERALAGLPQVAGGMTPTTSATPSP